MVLLAAYFKAAVTFFIAIIILVQIFANWFLYISGPQYLNLQKLYKTKDNTTYFQDEELQLQESRSILITAVLTSWITTGTVWSNNFSYQSFFLITSSVISFIIHTLSLSSIYIYTNFEELSLISLAPITHCFLREENILQNMTFINFSKNNIFNLIRVCSNSDTCEPIQRLCLEFEKPTDYFYLVVGPTGFSCLIISLLASVCLQNLGNYYKLYQWSRNVFCCCPILHASFLQDSIINNAEEILQNFEEIIKNNNDIINIKDPLYGDTPLITAAKGNSFHMLKKMVKLKVNFHVGNSNGETFLKIMEMKLNDSNHQEWKELMNIIESNEIKYYTRGKIWTEQPMIKAVRKDQYTILCFLSILGGQWGTANIENISVLNFVLNKLENENFDLSQCNSFVKWQIRRATNEYNQSLMILAAIHGEAKCLKVLVKSKANVNVRKKDNGRTPLHYSSRLEDTDCTSILIEHSADINATSFHNKTPLHDAGVNLSMLYEQLLWAQIPKAQKKTDNLTVFLHSWDLCAQKLQVEH